MAKFSLLLVVACWLTQVESLDNGYDWDLLHINGLYLVGDLMILQAGKNPSNGWVQRSQFHLVSHCSGWNSWFGLAYLQWRAYIQVWCDGYAGRKDSPSHCGRVDLNWSFQGECLLSINPASHIFPPHDHGYQHEGLFKAYSQLGYLYINLDDCWAAGRYPNGALYSDWFFLLIVCFI